MVSVPTVPNPLGVSSGTTSELGKLYIILFILGAVMFALGLIMRFAL